MKEILCVITHNSSCFHTSPSYAFSNVYISCYLKTRQAARQNARLVENAGQESEQCYVYTISTLQHTATHCNTLQHTAQQESEQCYVYTISNVICFVYRGKQRQKQRDEMLAVLKMLGKSMSKVKHVTFEIVLKMLPSISNTASVSSRFFCLCFPL